MSPKLLVVSFYYAELQNFGRCRMQNKCHWRLIVVTVTIIAQFHYSNWVLQLVILVMTLSHWLSKSQAQGFNYMMYLLIVLMSHSQVNNLILITWYIYYLIFSHANMYHVDADIFHYKLSMGLCLTVVVIIMLVLIVTLMLKQVRRKRMKCNDD